MARTAADSCRHCRMRRTDLESGARAGGPGAERGDELGGPRVVFTHGGFGLAVPGVLSAERIDRDGEIQTSHA